MNSNKTILLTGATGTLGRETLSLFLQQGFDVVLICLPTPAEKARLMPYFRNPHVHIAWGNLKDYNVIYHAVSRVDFVVHVAALIPPAADYQPEEAVRVNYGSVLHFINAIRAQSRDIPFVYISSLAVTGSRLPPIHWGRVGDPVCPSMYDYYALSKVYAERALYESGLSRWVILRQTAMMPPNSKSVFDGIVYHQPLDNVLEWVSATDTAKLLNSICAGTHDEAFWRRTYNIGGGPAWRANNYRLMREMCAINGMEDMHSALDPGWFATQNFHGQFFLDSHELEDMFHYQSGGFEEFMQELRTVIRPLPKFLLAAKPLMRAAMRRIALGPNGPLRWIRGQDEDRIEAFFGSYEKWENIPGWEAYSEELPDSPPVHIDHGYDESVPIASLSLSALKQAAEFRGGRLESVFTDGAYEPLMWRCAKGHMFSASPNLVLQGGHWCPDCEREAWDYGMRAQQNPFFAQIWTPLHDGSQMRSYAKVVQESIVNRREAPPRKKIAYQFAPVKAWRLKYFFRVKRKSGAY